MRRFLRVMIDTVANAIFDRDALKLSVLPPALVDRMVRAEAERIVRRHRYPRGSSKLSRRLRRKHQLGRAGAF